MESADSTVRLSSQYFRIRVLLIVADQCEVFSFSLQLQNTLILTYSFRWLFCSAICVGCFLKGEHKQHDYGEFIVTTSGPCTIDGDLCRLMSIKSCSSILIFPAFEIHAWWLSHRIRCCISIAAVLLVCGLNLILMFLDEGDFMLLGFHVILVYNNWHKLYKRSIVSQWVGRVLWLWRSRGLEGYRVSTVLDVK